MTGNIRTQPFLLSNDYILSGSVENPDDIKKFLKGWPTTNVDDYHKVTMMAIVSRELE